jgi:hypothetical protein
MARQRLELIPERLRFHAEPLARHHPHLAFQREMIGVLGDRDTHGERGAVAPTRDHRRGGGGRGDDRAVARTAIFLPDVVLDVIHRLHRGDPLGGFGLSRELGERAAARRAGARVGGQLMPHLDDRQGGLGARAMPWTGWARCRRRRRRRAGQNRGARLLELVLDGECQLLHRGQCPQPRELRGQLQILRDESLVLPLEQETDLAEGLHVVFVLQRHHAAAHLIIVRDPRQARTASTRAA